MTMRLNLLCCVLLFTCSFCSGIHAGEPVESDSQRLSKDVDKAEASATQAAVLIQEHQAKFTAGTCHLPKEKLGEIAKAKGLSSSDCSGCHRVPDSLKDELEKQVRDTFDLRMKLQRTQLADAESRLKATSENLDRREQIRDKIIQRRVDELAGGVNDSWLGKQTRASGLSPLSESKSENLTPVQEAKLPVDASICSRVFGMTVKDSGQALPGHFRGCVEITDVKPGCTAEQAGCRPGDLLVGIHQWETVDVGSVLSVAKVLSEGTVPSPVKFYLVRDGQTLAGNFALPSWVNKSRDQSYKEQTRLIEQAMEDIENKIREKKKALQEIDAPKDGDPMTDAMLNQLAEKIASLEIESTSVSTELKELKDLKKHEAYIQLMQLNKTAEKETGSEFSDQQAQQLADLNRRVGQLIRSVCSDASIDKLGLTAVIELTEAKQKLLARQLEAFQLQLAEQNELVRNARKLRAADASLRREVERLEQLYQRVEQRRYEIEQKHYEIDKGDFNKPKLPTTNAER
ncbi:MAG: hypothetical protein WBD20_12830 [Pirellulaceae bacterium]